MGARGDNNRAMSGINGNMQNRGQKKVICQKLSEAVLSDEGST